MPLTEEVRAIAGAPAAKDADFDDLARRVLARQLRHHTSYAALAAARGITPEALEHAETAWQNVPPIPTSAFAHLPLHIGQPSRVFRSSGTTRDGAPRSQHHHAELDLYRDLVDRSFPSAVFAEPKPASSSRTLLSLIPPIRLVDDSSLGFMVDHVMTRWGDHRSTYAFEEERLAPQQALDWLRVTAREANHPVLLTTALALWSVLDGLEDDQRSRHSSAEPWPENLRIMETGGFKTERFRLTREDLLDRLADRAGVRAEQVVREYGMTELTSQAYSDPENAPEIFELPHWTRVRTLDPETLEDVSPGTPGLLAFLDLGNVDSAAYVLTEDLGRLAPGETAAGRRFELIGRARDAQLRGCSLTTEQLL